MSPQPIRRIGHWRPPTEPATLPVSGRWSSLTEAAEADAFTLMRYGGDVVQVLDLAATLLHRHRHPDLAAIIGEPIQQLAELIEYGGPGGADSDEVIPAFWVTEHSVPLVVLARHIVRNGGSLDFP